MESCQYGECQIKKKAKVKKKAKAGRTMIKSLKREIAWLS
ncbi:hypothetical protein B4110_0813 [Parageobacillus toebii]|uniref:Uncharacterized protein n=1 Tax=Parageobacillus toebii TaxID=153151 RepID=A0A150MUD6_9BACL|nr:hypothetical protein B4110_0813 [Parageobacillus toebii]